jgi:hypothetical protein
VCSGRGRQGVLVLVFVLLVVGKYQARLLLTAARAVCKAGEAAGFAVGEGVRQRFEARLRQRGANLYASEQDAQVTARAFSRAAADGCGSCLQLRRRRWRLCLPFFPTLPPIIPDLFVEGCSEGRHLVGRELSQRVCEANACVTEATRKPHGARS